MRLVLQLLLSLQAASLAPYCVTFVKPESVAGVHDATLLVLGLLLLVQMRSGLGCETFLLLVDLLK